MDLYFSPYASPTAVWVVVQHAALVPWGVTPIIFPPLNTVRRLNVTLISPTYYLAFNAAILHLSGFSSISATLSRLGIISWFVMESAVGLYMPNKGRDAAVPSTHKECHRLQPTSHTRSRRSGSGLLRSQGSRLHWYKETGCTTKALI